MVSVSEGGTIMAGKAVPKMKGVRVFPPAPKGFDALAARKTDLARHGIPQRPDPRTQPGPAALWEQRMRRYQDFEHLKPEIIAPDKVTEPVLAGFGLPPLVSCGFELTFPAPIVIFSGTWTVPNLNHTPTSGGFPNHLHTFFALGFLDVHVEMTVDSAQNVTALIRIHTGAQVALPVRPGDAISAILCLQTNPAGTAFYGLANETTSQTVNFNIDTGFPPAVAITAGITRDSQFNGPPDPLAGFGVVYFDELSAFATSGTPRLTDGVATTMVDSNGSTLATPQRLTDFMFKII
jgi:Peptidase A4 family